MVYYGSESDWRSYQLMMFPNMISQLQELLREFCCALWWKLTIETFSVRKETPALGSNKNFIPKKIVYY